MRTALLYAVLIPSFTVVLLVWIGRSIRNRLNERLPLRNADVRYDQIVLRLREIDAYRDVSEIGYLRRLLSERPIYNEQERLQAMAAPILRTLETLAAENPQAARASRKRRSLPGRFLALPRPLRIGMGAAALLVIAICGLAAASALYFPSEGEGPLRGVVLRARVAPVDGNGADLNLVFSSMSAQTWIDRRALEPMAALAEPGQGGSARMTIFAGRYGVDTDAIASAADGTSDIHGVLGTGALMHNLRHGDRYLTLDPAHGKWQVGNSPYRPATDAIAYPLGLLSTSQSSAYTLDLELDGTVVHCVFDTLCRYPIAMPEPIPPQPMTFAIGRRKATVTAVSTDRLPEGTAARGIAHIGIGMFGNARVTMDPARRWLYVELPDEDGPQ